MEVFASVQGEGLHVGEPQVFVRLRGCPLRCRYCDTPGSWSLASGPTRIAARGGARRAEGDTVTPFQVACWVREVEGAPRAVSVTGGEPLLWPQFVRELGPLLADRPLHLETAGAHVEALAQVLDVVHHVSLDLKASVDLDPPAADDPALPRDAEGWQERRVAALRMLRGRGACAKLIVTGEGSYADYDELLEDVWEHAPEMPVVLQPVTPVGQSSAPPHDLLERLLERALELELGVRVLPQVHRALGLR